MVPSTYTNYFVACAGAAAALIGLLFVAISIDPDNTVGPKAPMVRRTIAGSAFTALLNAFFIALGALLPGNNLGPVALIMSFFGIINTVLICVRLLKRHEIRQFLVQRASLITASLIIYGIEAFAAGHLIAIASDVGYVYTLAVILIAVYSVALGRVWELLGAERRGLRGIIESAHAPPDPNQP